MMLLLAVFVVLLVLRYVIGVFLAPNFGSESLKKLILDLFLLIILILSLSTRGSILRNLTVDVFEVADLGALAVTITASLLLESLDLIVEVVRADLPAAGRRLRATEIIVVLLIEHSFASSLQALLLARCNDFVE